MLAVSLTAAQAAAASPEGEGGGSRCGGRLREEMDLIAPQPPVEIGLLRPAGGRQHVLAHVSEHAPDIEAGGDDALQQRRRERAVPALAVLGGGAVLGGIRHQGAADRLDAAKPARAAPGRGEGVVAAGVEDHQPEPRHAVELAEHGVERNRLQVDVARRGQPRIGRDEVVATARLDAVAGEVDQPKLRPPRQARQLTQRRPEAIEAQVLAQEHRVELELPLQGLGHRLRIVQRIGQPPDLVVGIADHQRHAPGLGRQRCLRGHRGEQWPRQRDSARGPLQPSLRAQSIAAASGYALLRQSNLTYVSSCPMHPPQPSPHPSNPMGTPAIESSQLRQFSQATFTDGAQPGPFHRVSSCRPEAVAILPGYRISSRIARSSPSSVSGYMRPPRRSRISLMEGVQAHCASGTGLSHTECS